MGMKLKDFADKTTEKIKKSSKVGTIIDFYQKQATKITALQSSGDNETQEEELAKDKSPQNEVIVNKLKDNNFLLLAYYKRAKQIWRLLLVTMPLDLLLLLYLPENLMFFKNFSAGWWFTTLLLVSGLMLSFRSGVLYSMAHMQKIQSNVQNFLKKYLLVIVIVIGAAIFLHSLYNATTLDTTQLVVILTGAFLGALSWYIALHQAREFQSRLLKDLDFLHENNSRYVFWINIIPAIMVRIASLSAVLSHTYLESNPTLLFLSLSAALLLMLKLDPQKPDFTCPCSKCGRLTSSLSWYAGACPLCINKVHKVITSK